MRRPTDVQISIYYGHELYANLTGKKTCDCAECNELRPKVYMMLWKSTKKVSQAV